MTSVIRISSATVKIDETAMFSSLVWTERYADIGDFELENGELRYNIGDLLVIEKSPVTMIVEAIEDDVGDDTTVLYSGSSIETLLKRRYVTTTTIVNGDAQTAVLQLIFDHMISPSDGNRVMDNVQTAVNPAVAGYSTTGAWQPNTLYGVVKGILDTVGMGFRIRRGNGVFICEVYMGANRSHEQTHYPRVLLSPRFGNVLSTTNTLSTQGYANVCTVISNDPVVQSVTVYRGNTVPTGWSRREIVEDMGDINRNPSSGLLSDQDVQDIMEQRGYERLSEYRLTSIFDGQVILPDDLNIGDVLTCEVGEALKIGRYTERIISVDNRGVATYPTVEFDDY